MIKVGPSEVNEPMSAGNQQQEGIINLMVWEREPDGGDASQPLQFLVALTAGNKIPGLGGAIDSCPLVAEVPKSA